LKDREKMKTKNPTYHLTFDDAVEIWLRHWNGEYQHHIAAHFGVNQGRVSDVLNGRLHFGSRDEAAKRRKAA
jgi:hypothetical protein